MLIPLWITLGALTKANAFPWLVPTVICFVLLDVPLRERLWRLSFLLLSVSLSALYYVWRFFNDVSFGVVQNAGRLSPAFRVDVSLSSLLTFNPIALLAQPFVHNHALPFRPEYFLESLLRSMHFGSFSFSQDSVYLLIFAMFALPIGVFGMMSFLQKRQTLPAITCFVSLLSLFLFCVHFPYSSSQHFRYIAVTALPLVLCMTEGYRSFRLFFLRVYAEIVTFLYSLVCMLFFVGIFWLAW